MKKSTTTGKTMTKEIPKRRFKYRKREMRKEARQTAYAMLLEETDSALEFQYRGKWYYVVGVDGQLYRAENNGEPKETTAQRVELFFTADRVDIIPAEQCHEFEEVL